MYTKLGQRMSSIIGNLLALLFFHAIQPLHAQTIDDALTQFIKTESLSPDAYVVEKFKTNDVVLLGESHLIKENLQFVQGLIPKLYANGVHNIGMEFGAYELQDKVDQLITAKEYDEKLAQEIMYAYNVTWGFQEYIDVYKAAWKFNLSLPAGAKKFRIVNLSYRFRWDRFNGTRTQESMAEVFEKGTVDKFRAGVVEKEVLQKKEKILALVGTPHAYTKYGSPYYLFNGDNFCGYDHNWLGNRLYKEHPTRVFNILLHQAFTQKTDGQYLLVSPLDGLLEKIMRTTNNNEPVGFDLLNTPIGNLPDRSTNSQCYDNFTLGQLFDGYIFLEPLHELEGCSLVEGFVNEGNLETTLRLLPDPDWHPPVKTLGDVLKLMKDSSDHIRSSLKDL